MKLIVILAVIALSNGAKLDNTYLPPSYAQTSGGSGNFLQTPTPGQSPNEYQRHNGFGQTHRGPSRNGVAQIGNDYAQGRNDFTNFAQTGNGFAQNGNDYAQNTNSFAQNGNAGNSNNGFENFVGRPERAQAAFERNAAILRQDTLNDGQTYSFAYETENGIVAEENGVATNGVEAQGGFSYTGDDGQVYSIRYTADQNGFVPQGDHLPTPPPIPEEILRVLEQNARDEAAGIYDDGSYNEAKYGSGNENRYNSNNNIDSNNNFDNNNNFHSGNTFNKGNNYYNNNDDEDTVVTNNALFRNDNRPSFGNQAGSNGPSYNQGFRNQGNQAGIGNQNGSNGSSHSSGFRNQGNQGFANQAPGTSNKAYLPPFDSQRSGSNQRNSFGRRQSTFNAKNGNQY